MCTCDVEFYTRDVVLWCTGDSQIKSKSNLLCAIMSRMAQFVRVGFHKSLMGLASLLILQRVDVNDIGPWWVHKKWA